MMWVQFETMVRFECQVGTADGAEAERLGTERLSSLPAMTLTGPNGRPVEGVHIVDDWQCTAVE